MKKVLSLLLICLCLILVLAGCSQSTADAWMEAWQLDDGKTEENTIASAIETGTPGQMKWGVWLRNDTFGKVLDFSTAGSYAYFPETKADFSGQFTISAWVKAPIRDVGDRVIVAYGDKEALKLYLNAENGHELALHMDGMTIESSGVGLADGLWHHVVVTRGQSNVTYYIDGKEVKTATATGTFEPAEKADIYVGGDRKGRYSFDGSIAEVKLARGVLTPAQISDTVLKESDNIPKDTRLALDRGVVIDRPQYTSNLIPLSYTTQQDIINCRNMGFDHVKIQLTPEWMMGSKGQFLDEKMEYVDSIVAMIQELDYQAIVCVSPCASGINYDFKTLFLGNLERFEELCVWYEGLAKHAKDQGWDPDNIAIQLMTEPYDNVKSIRWDWMSDRMYGAVRNILPDTTIITSANRSGNLEYVKLMSPATDDNLIYSFTTYEPYAVGWHTAYSSQIGQTSFWDFVGDVPYPIEEGVDYTQQIEDALKDMPDAFMASAKAALEAYVRGEYDGGTTYWENHYDHLYNRQWHMLRAQSLDQWRQDNGGNIHIMVVEFGCYDSKYSSDRFGAAGTGIPDSKRLMLIKDMREAWEAYDIGWCYWSYNEGFTVFTPEYHVNHVGGSPSAEEAARYADYELLTDALGLTPSMGYENDAWSTGAVGAWQLQGEDGLTHQIPGSADAARFGAKLTDEGLQFDGNSAAFIRNAQLDVTDSMTVSTWIKAESDGVILSSGQAWLDESQDRFYIHDFEEFHNIWGTNVGPSSAYPAQGEACVGGSFEGRGDIVIVFQTQMRDFSDYLSTNNGLLHLSVYVADPTRVVGGQLELTADRQPNDQNELSWALPGTWQAGWNYLTFRVSDAINNTTDLTNIRCCRVYFHVTDSVEVMIDDMYMTHKTSTPDQEKWTLGLKNGQLQFTAGGKSTALSAGASLTDGQWHHVLVQFSGNKVTAYVDGQEQDQKTALGLKIRTENTDLVLGSDTHGENGFSGSMKYLSVYNQIVAPAAVWQEK